MSRSRAKGRRSSLKRHNFRPGSAPGVLTPRPETSGPVKISLIDYGPDHFEERRLDHIEEAFDYKERDSVTWINVEGLSDVELIAQLGDRFGFHKLALEDVVNCGQRPKVEPYDDYEFLILRSVQLDQGTDLIGEQISLFLGAGYVVTFQEIPGDSWEAVRERIRLGRGLIRKRGSDYLAYALVDALIDEFFPVLERYGEEIERLENELIEKVSPGLLLEIHKIKRDLLMLRRAAWPERDLLNSILRDGSELITAETRIFLRDCYDHVVQVIDVIETYRELAGGMLDVYLSSQSNRMNEIMKVLTILSAIFIPLSFIAGVYGMYFDTGVSHYNMPELHWVMGYPFALSLMAAVALVLIGYFKKKGWF